MSCYAVTRDNRLLRWDAPAGKASCLRDEGAMWRFYYKTCSCAKCEDRSHEALITFVEKAQVVSVGFDRPAAIEGRMLTWTERDSLRQVTEWLKKRSLPWKVKRLMPGLESLLALCSKS